MYEYVYSIPEKHFNDDGLDATAAAFESVRETTPSLVHVQLPSQLPHASIGDSTAESASAMRLPLQHDQRFDDFQQVPPYLRGTRRSKTGAARNWANFSRWYPSSLFRDAESNVSGSLPHDTLRSLRSGRRKSTSVSQEQCYGLQEVSSTPEMMMMMMIDDPCDAKRSKRPHFVSNSALLMS